MPGVTRSPELNRDMRFVSLSLIQSLLACNTFVKKRLAIMMGVLSFGVGYRSRKKPGEAVHFPGSPTL